MVVVEVVVVVASAAVASSAVASAAVASSTVAFSAAAPPVASSSALLSFPVWLAALSFCCFFAFSSAATYSSPARKRS